MLDLQPVTCLQRACEKINLIKHPCIVRGGGHLHHPLHPARSAAHPSQVAGGVPAQPIGQPRMTYFQIGTAAFNLYRFGSSRIFSVVWRRSTCQAFASPTPLALSSRPLNQTQHISNLLCQIPQLHQAPGVSSRSSVCCFQVRRLVCGLRRLSSR
jgi:hypothetical protein